MKNTDYRKINLKIGFLLFLLSFLPIMDCSAQYKVKDSLVNDTTIIRLQKYSSVVIPENFDWKYKLTKRRVKKVYPMALKAARILDSLQTTLKNTKNNSKKRRIIRRLRKKLKHQFKFKIKDLYQSEGRVLTKLIYRETGKTVNQILDKYAGGFTSFWYTTISSFVNQDLDMEYHPNKNPDDFVIECVVQDIKHGKISFDPTFEPMNKEEYKESMKEYRQNKRAHRKEMRKKRREKRRKERNK